MKLNLLLHCALTTSVLYTHSVHAQQVDKPAAIKDYVRDTGVRYGAWRSTVLGSGGYLQHVVGSPTNPQRFYMTSDVGGLFRSDDGGSTWRMLHGALPSRGGSYEVRGLVVDPRDDKKVAIATGSQYGEPEGIYVSSDAGQSWARTLTARFVGNGGARWTGRVLVRDAQNPDVLATAGVGDGVFVSRDNGATWTSAGAKDLYPNDLVIDRASPKRMWLSSGGGKIKGKDYLPGFYRTEDAGANWKKIEIEGGVPSEIVQDPRDPQVLVGIFGNAWIKRSRDQGATWEMFSDGLPTQAPEPGKGKPSISKTTYRAITAGPDFLLVCNTSDADFFKLPSGQTKWQKIERGKPQVGDWYGADNNWYFGGAAGSITVDPNDAAHWFVTDYGALWQTRDSGKNWKLTIDGVEMTVAHCVTQDPTDPAIVHAGVADVGASVSLNGGRRLAKGNVPNENGDQAGGGNMKAIDLSPRLPNRLYAVGNKNYHDGWASNQVFVSIDRGTTWRRSPMAGLPDMRSQRCTTIAADLNDPYTVYISMSGGVRAGWGGVYKSTDGGASWSWIGEGLPSGKFFFASDIWAHGRQIAVGSDGALIAVSQNENHTFRFDPKTQKWSSANLRGQGGKPWMVVADRLKAGRFFVGMQNEGLYRTDDSGATWKKVYSKGVTYVATDGAVANRVAGGTSDGVILSLDGGATWKEMDKGLPYRVGNIPAFAGERLVVGTGGNGMFWTPLSAEGEKDVAAKPLVIAAPPASNNVLPTLTNFDFESEGAPVPGWKLETTKGAATIARSNKAARGKGHGLLLLAAEETSGTLSQEFTPTTSLMMLSGSWWPKGQWKSVRAEVQSLDAQGAVISTLAAGRISGDKKWWESWAQAVALGQSARRCRLQIAFEGQGQIALDGFALAQPQPLFLQSKMSP